MILISNEEIKQHLNHFFAVVNNIVKPYFDINCFKKRLFRSRGVILFEKITEKDIISVDYCNYIQYGISAFRVMLNSPKHYLSPILDDDNHNSEQWRYSDETELKEQLKKTIKKLEFELEILTNKSGTDICAPNTNFEETRQMQ